MFIGGNKEKWCYNYNLAAKQWVKAGQLPKFFTVTEHINVKFGEQVLLVFVQVNFNENCFQFMICGNDGNHGKNEVLTEWQMIAKKNTDIQYFHIKNAFIIGQTLIFFSRGKPKDDYDVCSSFLLCVPLVIENGRVKDVEVEKYSYIKVDQLAYAEYKTLPQINMLGDEISIKMPQEDNYAEGFPRQLLEFTVKNDLTKNQDLNDTPKQKIISVDFPGKPKDEKAE